MPLRLAFLEFRRGYHVGWRYAERIVDHATVVRGLVSIAYSLGLQSLAEELARGVVTASALLPALRLNEHYRLLAPFPPLPSTVKLSKLGIEWATLPAIRKLLEFSNEWARSNGFLLLAGVEGERILIDCCQDSCRESRRLELVIAGSIACSNENDCRGLPRDRLELFKAIEETHNRIDRATGSADLYRVRGYMPTIPLWLGLVGDEDVLDKVSGLLKLLGEIGLGGYRSRGWGLFRILEDVDVSSSDESLLHACLGWRRDYNLLLGSIPPGDWMDRMYSYARARLIMGISGPSYEEYKLPVLKVMDVGGLVYARDVPKPFTYKIRMSHPKLEAVVLFNPLVVGVY